MTKEISREKIRKCKITNKVKENNKMYIQGKFIPVTGRGGL
jgi:hypothetical protein